MDFVFPQKCNFLKIKQDMKLLTGLFYSQSIFQIASYFLIFFYRDPPSLLVKSVIIRANHGISYTIYVNKWDYILSKDLHPFPTAFMHLEVSLLLLCSISILIYSISENGNWAKEINIICNILRWMKKGMLCGLWKFYCLTQVMKTCLDYSVVNG